MAEKLVHPYFLCRAMSSLPRLGIWRCAVLGVVADRGHFLLHAPGTPDNWVMES